MKLADTTESYRKGEGAHTNWVIDQIRSVKELIDSPKEMVQWLKTLCPSVLLDKYAMYTYTTTSFSTELRKEHADAEESQIYNTDKKNIQEGKKYPLCIVIIEQCLLYSDQPTRDTLDLIVAAIYKEISDSDLIFIHKLLANGIISSYKYNYAEEYDRWLILAVIKVMKVKKTEEYCLEYFPGIVERITTAANAFRDRAIILSDYLTDGNLSHETPESSYFYNDIPSTPIIEERDDSPEEENDQVMFITTLTEYYFLIKNSKFESEPSERVEEILLQLPRLLLTEKLAIIKKYCLDIIRIHAGIQTKEAIDGICAVLLVDDIAYSAFSIFYDRKMYSLHFKRIIASCLQIVSYKLRKDVILRILDRYSSKECSEEEKKLGLDVFFKKISTCHSI
ncbi:hypothetical protein NEPAR06_0292 [Nematocida parisii]|uniref:Uncharacterized protein n=1 Tax=Nematocida parisii (strain ERTm3) TaxID=935791 RepID=I3EIX3_NEMP3|nr:uncharacterized protein NEPG_01622 [Nematocida parisii ERTm1]EIJ89170.1 hypothetical protein NEQG_00989 [Nematocida parisii ERTm3]KAI5142900.1 hypothetical protein NEPAR07_0354 [Nematocida parisii]EIJ93280.1 hypothetical protein NEPG_01622 [Nematocida parisii ERTm1]KAI5153242.1 hypothetical protein NEPAR06_0292 [Nematocida parisii]KAI5156042.1 hypothetical protein NEPAR05_0252 [Nematocida parisii]|eukprot:XP_013059450.1 hypothetical protein NEPG_01622 [Nematocida parisii ERTm1]